MSYVSWRRFNGVICHLEDLECVLYVSEGVGESCHTIAGDIEIAKSQHVDICSRHVEVYIVCVSVHNVGGSKYIMCK